MLAITFFRPKDLLDLKIFEGFSKLIEVKLNFSNYSFSKNLSFHNDDAN